MLNNKYNKNYINNLSSPKLYNSNETSEEINEFLNPKIVIQDYEVLDTKTNDKYEVALDSISISLLENNFLLICTHS